MSQKKSKPRINTNGKQYLLEQSPFYQLNSKRFLAKILSSTIEEIEYLRTATDRYYEFDDISNPNKPRKIQKPNKRLDIIQSRIASLLCRIEVPAYLQSGRKKHSHVSNAIAHINDFGSVPILTTDIKSFFPSTTWTMVFNYYRYKLKCSMLVSSILTDLCTFNEFVPTGSRISMPIAFWANSWMFSELYKLSEKHNVKMSVYVDDLTFSGVNVNSLFCSTVCKVISRHGHIPHPLKTRLYNKESVKVITGVAIVGNKIKATNAQQFKLSQEIESWKAIKDQALAVESLTVKRLIGRLNSLAIIDNRYKDKARSIKQAM